MRVVEPARRTRILADATRTGDAGGLAPILRRPYDDSIPSRFEIEAVESYSHLNEVTASHAGTARRGQRVEGGGSPVVPYAKTYGPSHRNCQHRPSTAPHTASTAIIAKRRAPMNSLQQTRNDLADDEHLSLAAPRTQPYPQSDTSVVSGRTSGDVCGRKKAIARANQTQQVSSPIYSRRNGNERSAVRRRWKHA